MDAKFLRREAQKLRMNANQDHRFAEKKEQTVEALKREGDDSRASVAEHEVASLSQGAQALELEALALERQAEAKEQEAEQLDAQERELRQNFEQELKRIEDKRRELLG